RWPAQDIGRQLLQKGYTFDFVSDRLLKDATAADDVLRVGDVSYQALVLPHTNYIPLETLERILALVHDGATVVLQSSLPSDVPAYANLEERRGKLKAQLDKLSKPITLANGDHRIEYGRGIFLSGTNSTQLPQFAWSEKMVDQGLRFVRRRIGDSRVYFIDNR